MSATHKRLAGYARRPRSTKAQHRAFCDALVEIVNEVQPCTVRQVYYQGMKQGIARAHRASQPVEYRSLPAWGPAGLSLPLR